MYGDAADREAAAAESTDAHSGRLEGVAVPYLDVVRADAEGVGRDLRPGRLVPLAVRGSAGEHLDRAGRMDADAGALVAPPADAERGVRLGRRESADLDVAGDADAAVVASRACLGPTLLEGLVVGYRERAVQRRRVVPAVVGDSADRVERERLRRDEVPPAKDGGIESDLVGEPVHRALDRVGGLGTARAPVRVDRRGVRVDPPHLAVEGRNPVRAGNDERVKDRRDARREGLQVGAHVGDRPDAGTEHGAVAFRGELDVLDEIAPVNRREVALAALLGPLHRAAERLGEVAHEELLGVDLELAPKAASDLRRDDAHLVLRKTEVQRGDELHEVRDLCRRPEGELAGVESGDDGARLHGVRDESLVHQMEPHGDLRVPEGLLDVPALHRIGKDEVRAELLVKYRRVGQKRLGRVDDDRERFVVHRHRLGRAPGRLTRLGHDRRDGVADIARFVGGERHVLRAIHARDRDEHRQHAGRLGVLTGEHRHDAGLFPRRRAVDPPDARVGMRAPHEREINHAGKGDVIGEDRVTGHQTRILFARNAGADVAGRSGRGHRLTSAATEGCAEAPRISVAAARMAFTMLW